MEWTESKWTQFFIFQTVTTFLRLTQYVVGRENIITWFMDYRFGIHLEKKHEITKEIGEQVTALQHTQFLCEIDGGSIRKSENACLLTEFYCVK